MQILSSASTVKGTVRAKVVGRARLTTQKIAQYASASRFDEEGIITAIFESRYNPTFLAVFLFYKSFIQKLGEEKIS